MPVDLRGTILITGASSGIGRALATQVASTCAKLILVARRRAELDSLADEVRSKRGVEVLVEPCDLTDRTALTALVQSLKARNLEINVLINNAGFGDLSMYELSSWARTEQMIDLNVRALAYLTHAFLPKMIERRSGGVLNISSGVGLESVPGFASYTGTKHFVDGFTESLRAEQVGTGVCVTQVCPGPVRTEFADRVGNFTSYAAPRWIEITATQCANESLKGLLANRPLVIPGFWVKILMGVAAITPRFVKRWLLRRVVPKTRALQKSTKGVDLSS